jgi:hypothetical protein
LHPTPAVPIPRRVRRRLLLPIPAPSLSHRGVVTVPPCCRDTRRAPSSLARELARELLASHHVESPATTQSSTSPPFPIPALDLRATGPGVVAVPPCRRAFVLIRQIACLRAVIPLPYGCAAWGLKHETESIGGIGKGMATCLTIGIA